MIPVEDFLQEVGRCTNQRLIDLTAAVNTILAGLTGSSLLVNKTSLNAVQVQFLNSVPVQIVPAAGAGTGLFAIGLFANLTFNTTAFNNNNLFVAPAALPAAFQMGIGGILASVANSFRNADSLPGATTNIVANDALVLTADVDSAGIGDSTIDVYTAYIIQTL